MKRFKLFYCELKYRLQVMIHVLYGKPAIYNCYFSKNIDELINSENKDLLVSRCFFDYR